MGLSAISARGAVLLVMALMLVVLAGGLSSTPANRSANRWLAAFLLVLSGVALDYVVDVSRLDRTSKILRHLPLGLTLALGPLIWGYVHRLTVGRAPRASWLHFAPAGFQAVYLIGLFVAPDSIRAPLTDGRGHDPIGPVLQLALPVSLAVYTVANLGLMEGYRRWVVQARSDADQYATRWLRNLLLVMAISVAGEAAVRLVALSGRRVDVFDVYPLYLWLLAMGCYLGVEARRYLERPFPPMSAATPDDRPPGVEKDWRALGADWRARTRAAGWWREPSLTLPELARRLGVNTGYLSRAINEGLGQNFSEMINTMRAEAVADQLDVAWEADDLLRLALDAGFGSKSSFNRAFRARFGVTPSAYRASSRVKS